MNLASAFKELAFAQVLYDGIIQLVKDVNCAPLY